MTPSSSLLLALSLLTSSSFALAFPAASQSSASGPSVAIPIDTSQPPKYGTPLDFLTPQQQSTAIDNSSSVAKPSTFSTTATTPNSYGSPLIAGATNYSIVQSLFASAPSIPTYPQPALGIDLSQLGLGLFGRPILSSFTYADPMLFLGKGGNPIAILRDLGFTGVLGGKLIWTFGDTLQGTPTNNRPCAVDSTAIGVDLKRPFLAQDTAMFNGCPTSLIPLTADELAGGGYNHYAFGGTNIVETSPGVGLIYYLINYRSSGSPDANIMGAGAAQVKLNKNNVPVVKRFGTSLWGPTEPTWGDVGIALDQRDGYVYVFGRGPAGTSLNSYTYVCRVPKAKASDVNSYQYWNNGAKQWTSQRFGDGTNGTLATTSSMAVLGWYAMNQAAPFWSNYFQRWVFIHCDGFGDPAIILKTSLYLNGPWIDHGEIAVTAPDIPADGYGNLRYAVMGHPEFDTSGKSVVVTWSRSNRIYGGVIQWGPI